MDICFIPYAASVYVTFTVTAIAHAIVIAIATVLQCFINCNNITMTATITTSSTTALPLPLHISYPYRTIQHPYSRLPYNILPVRASGPGVLGEGPLHQIPNPARFVNKDGKYVHIIERNILCYCLCGLKGVLGVLGILCHAFL